MPKIIHGSNKYSHSLIHESSESYSKGFSKCENNSIFHWQWWQISGVLALITHIIKHGGNTANDIRIFRNIIAKSRSGCWKARGITSWTVTQYLSDKCERNPRQWPACLWFRGKSSLENNCWFAWIENFDCSSFRFHRFHRFHISWKWIYSLKTDDRFEKVS